MGHFRTDGGAKCRNLHPSSRPNAEEGRCKVHLTSREMVHDEEQGSRG